MTFDTTTDQVTYQSMGRRSLIRAGVFGGAALAAAALIGCGDDDDDGDGGGNSATATAAPSGDATATSDDAAADIEYPGGQGELVQDPDLPYPYNFPEPAVPVKSGGVMVVGTTWDVQTIDPITSAAGGTVTVPNVTYNRLLGIDRGPDGDIFNAPVLEPELAQSWERSPDGLTFTFQMTPGVTWQNLDPLNGRPFVAEDARFALERYATDGVHQAYYNNASGFEAVDDATLKITMANPTADFLNPLGSNKQTIFPRELVDDGTIETRAIGTGPMILTALESGQRVAFDRNPDYWEREVLLDAFEFRIMPDLAARTAAFRVGQLDYAYSLAANLQALEQIIDTNPDVQINLTPVTYNVFTIAMNLTLPKYADERVRRAISLALDRDLMIDVVMDGLGKKLSAIPWPFLNDELPSVESGALGNWMRYAPDEAAKLLQAAGAEGLSAENIYYPYSGNEEKNAEIIQANLNEIGFDLSGGAVDYTEFNSNWVPAQLPDITTTGWTTTGFDPDNWFHGQVHSESPGNRWRINDAEIDGWAEQQQLELDPEVRRELWQKIWDKDLDMMYRPTVPYANAIHVYQPWVRGIRWTGSAPGDNSSYYNWGDQLAHAWLDK